MAYLPVPSNVLLAFALTALTPAFVTLRAASSTFSWSDTASNTTKPATVETGYTLQVPLFVEIGDKLRIDTRDGQYMSRS